MRSSHPINNTDPSGFDVNGEDSALGIMGWGAGTVGAAALSNASFSSIAGGTGIVGLNVGTSLLTGQYDLFNGSSASVHHGAAPSAAPKSTGANHGAAAGAGGRIRGASGCRIIEASNREKAEAKAAPERLVLHSSRARTLITGGSLRRRKSYFGQSSEDSAMTLLERRSHLIRTLIRRIRMAITSASTQITGQRGSILSGCRS
jgi:hypothetical protein